MVPSAAAWRITLQDSVNPRRLWSNIWCNAAEIWDLWCSQWCEMKHAAVIKIKRRRRWRTQGSWATMQLQLKGEMSYSTGNDDDGGNKGKREQRRDERTHAKGCKKERENRLITKRVEVINLVKSYCCFEVNKSGANYINWTWGASSKKL